MRAPLTLFTPFVLVLAAYGCSGGGSLDCTAFCAKAKECGSTDSADTCASACAQMNELFNGDFLAAQNDCLSGACDKMETCTQAATSKCSTDIDPFLDDYCQKMIDCQPQGGVTVDQCKTMLLKEGGEAMNYMKCISDDTLSTITSCITAAKCDALESASEDCMKKSINVNFK